MRHVLVILLPLTFVGTTTLTASATGVVEIYWPANHGHRMHSLDLDVDDLRGGDLGVSVQALVKRGERQPVHA